MANIHSQSVGFHQPVSSIPCALTINVPSHSLPHPFVSPGLPFKLLLLFCMYACMYFFICLDQLWSSGYSGMHCVNQTGFKHTEIHLPLPPITGIKGMRHRARLSYLLPFMSVWGRKTSNKSMCFLSASTFVVLASSPVTSIFWQMTVSFLWLDDTCVYAYHLFFIPQLGYCELCCSKHRCGSISVPCWCGTIQVCTQKRYSWETVPRADRWDCVRFKSRRSVVPR